MHHPTDRIVHTTTFVTPVVEQWLGLCGRESTHGVMGHQINPSDLFSFQPVLHNWQSAICLVSRYNLLQRLLHISSMLNTNC